MRRFVLAMAMVGMACGAQAADLPDLPILRGSVGGPRLVNWAGFYVGGQAAYGASTTKLPASLNGDMQSTFTPPTGSYNWQPLGWASSSATGYGAFAGYNWQWEDAVLGIEGNYLHNAIRSYSSSTGFTYTLPPVTVASVAYSRADVTLSDFGSLRARFGWAAGCFMPYGFLGAGVGSRTVNRFVSASPPSVAPVTWSTDTKEKLVYGYSAGFGLDTMIVGGLFVRAEYEYQRITADYESFIHSARVGVGYKF
jgi:outer membrane immunogenic protein